MRAKYNDFTIIIPTFNEGRTIGGMIDYVSAHYKGISVYVVDDGSNDGTQNIVKKKSATNSRIKLIDRHAKGLGKGLTASVIDGIKGSKTKYVIVIDADMQHPPSKIKDVAVSLIAGNDLVVANRAKITEWSTYRKIISRTFMYFGKIILFIRSGETCVDTFSGFFGVRRSLFMDVYNKNRRRFVPSGYKVLYDFLKCVPRGTLKISNVPFVFNVREFGESKAGAGQGFALIKSFFT